MKRTTNVPMLAILVLLAATASAEFHPDRSPADPQTRPTGDCVAGSHDFDTYQGWYSDFWGAEDAYAALMEVGDCGCAEGVTVLSMHMNLRVNFSASLLVQAELWSADLSGGCPVPLAPVAVSAAYQFSGFTSEGNVDLEIPFDSICVGTDEPWFAVIRFLPGSAGAFLGVPVDATPTACTTWVNRTGLAGWHDVVGEYGWLGNFYVYADLDCCSDPVAGEETSWGEVKTLFR